MPPWNKAGLLMLLLWLWPATCAGISLQLTAKNHHWQPRPQNGRAQLHIRPSGRWQLEATLLSGHTEYALITTTGRRNRGYAIAGGRSNAQGRLFLQGSWSIWQTKCWLVLRRDVAGKIGDRHKDRLQGWQPQHYLFEQRLLPFYQTYPNLFRRI